MLEIYIESEITDKITKIKRKNCLDGFRLFDSGISVYFCPRLFAKEAHPAVTQPFTYFQPEKKISNCGKV